MLGTLTLYNDGKRGVCRVIILDLLSVQAHLAHVTMLKRIDLSFLRNERACLPQDMIRRGCSNLVVAIDINRREPSLSNLQETALSGACANTRRVHLRNYVSGLHVRKIAKLLRNEALIHVIARSWWYLCRRPIIMGFEAVMLIIGLFIEVALDVIDIHHVFGGL